MVSFLDSVDPVRLHTHANSPGCTMWYQRVTEVDTIKEPSTNESQSVRDKLQSSLREDVIRKRKRQAIESHEDPRHFRRVRMKCRGYRKAYQNDPNATSTEEPIILVDSSDRKLTFPYDCCRTWSVSIGYSH